MLILKQILGNPLPYNDLESVRARLAEVSPTLTRYDQVEQANYFQENVKINQVSLTAGQK